MAETLTTSQFEHEVVNSDVPVLVDFWATWCQPCRAIAPFVDAVSEKFAGRAKVYKVDVDSEGELAEKFGILSIPALLLFKGGQEVDRMGPGSADQISAFVERHL